MIRHHSRVLRQFSLSFFFPLSEAGGKFKLDEANATIYHTMDVSMNPTWLGNTQPREYTLEDNVLTLVNGNNRNQKLIWDRVK